MKLEQDKIEWLAQHGVSASADCLERAYAVDHVLNASRKLDAQRVDHAKQCMFWHVSFRNGEGESVLEYPLARKLFPSAKLKGASTNAAIGKVALNATLYLKRQFHKQGFASAIYSAEAKLYRELGVQEIHVRAQGEGRTVWTKEKFGFSLSSPTTVALAYRRWTRDTLGVASEPPSSLHDYPDTFLISLDEVELHKVVQ